MQIFISWSGKTAESVANILYEWLPDVIQTVTPIISNRTEAGADWLSSINKGLRENGEGIIVVTPDSQNSTWLNYEAGVMAGQADSRVRPVTFQMRPADIELPLGTLQAVDLTNEKTMLQLLQDIGERETPSIAPARVERAFRQNWESLQGKFSAIAVAHVESSEPQRSSDDMLEEVLEGIRLLIRNQSDERERTELLDNAARRREADALARRVHTARSRLEEDMPDISTPSRRAGKRRPPADYGPLSSYRDGVHRGSVLWSQERGHGHYMERRPDGSILVDRPNGITEEYMEDLYVKIERDGPS